MRLTGILLALAACAHHGGDNQNTTYDSIVVEPALATLTIPLGMTGAQTYVVSGISSGTKKDITANCALTIDSNFGNFAMATVTVFPHGGKTTVTATCGTQSGTAELVVNLKSTVVVGTGTPGNAADQFNTAMPGTDPNRSPAVEYPIDHAVSPRNIPPIEIQWAAAGNDLFHITLASTFLSIDVYTIDVQATLAATDWDEIAETAAGDTLAFTVEGLSQAAPMLKYAGPSASVTMSRDTIDKTAIYYWASSQGNIMSQTFGDTAPPAVVKNDCTSCHSVSRAGTRIGYSRCVANDCGNLYAGFLHFDGTTKTWNEPVNANAMAIHGSYTTFAPVGNPFATDAQAVAIVSMVTGTLALFDPDTGAAIASNLAVATHGPGAPRSALMADWSPDGAKVVFASTPHPNQWIDVSDSAIAVMSYNYTGGAHMFGEPQFLVQNPITIPSGTYNNFFFPSFSPDGALIVFNAARAAWRNFNDARSPGQRLMLLDAGGAWGVDLTALDGAGDRNITWAHWAPTIGNDYYWLVFSSERDYGHEITATTTAPACKGNGVVQCKQLWIGAIAKSKLNGSDPSAPPMWLPGQDPKTDNISPYWSVPVGLQ
jgi:hypothetical protein